MKNNPATFTRGQWATGIMDAVRYMMEFTDDRGALLFTRKKKLRKRRGLMTLDQIVDALQERKDAAQEFSALLNTDYGPMRVRAIGPKVYVERA